MSNKKPSINIIDIIEDDDEKYIFLSNVYCVRLHFTNYSLNIIIIYYI